MYIKYLFQATQRPFLFWGRHVKTLCTPALTQFDFTIAFVFQMSLKVWLDLRGRRVTAHAFLHGASHSSLSFLRTTPYMLTVSIQQSKVLYSLSTLSSRQQKRVIKLHYLTLSCAPKQKQKRDQRH
jgi:hypothetical protein